MRFGLHLRCALILAGAVAVAAEAHAASPPAPSKPPCALDAKERKRAIREERQFLKRYPGEASHRRAQLADLKRVNDRIRAGHKRFYELAAQRKPLDKERAVLREQAGAGMARAQARYERRPVRSLTKTLRGHEQKIGEIQARYQCQRDTFGKLWAGAAPASSACDRPTCAQP
jgi:hypothetical protein